MPIPEWLSKMADRERQRREDASIIRSAATDFQRVIATQIHNDLAAYRELFPEEAPFIVIDNPGTGCSVIKRTRDATSLYTGVLPTVETHIEVRELLLVCKFQPFEGLNREFKLVSDENGKLGLAEGSIAQISEYILAPILFDKFADWV